MMGVFSPNIPVPSLVSGYSCWIPMLNLWLPPSALTDGNDFTLQVLLSSFFLFNHIPQIFQMQCLPVACGSLASDCLHPAACVWLVSPPNPHLFGWLVNLTQLSKHTPLLPYSVFKDTTLGTKGFWFIYKEHFKYVYCCNSVALYC